MGAVGGFRFEGLTADLQKEVLAFLPKELARDSQVSKLFQKLIDDPQLWVNMSKKYHFSVDPKNARSDFLYKYAIVTNPNAQAINDKLLTLLPLNPEVSQSIRKIGDVVEQRIAIESFISSHDYTQAIHQNPAQRTPADKIRINTRTLIEGFTVFLMEPISAEDHTIMGTISVLLRNGVNTYDFELGRRWIFFLSQFNFDVFNAYLECQKKNNRTVAAFNDDLSHAINRYAESNEKCISALLKAGAIPKHTQVAEALLAIAYQKGECEVSAEKAFGPLLNYYQSPNDQKVLNEASKMTKDLLGALDKKQKPQVWREYTPHKWTKDYLDNLQQIQSQVQKHLDANLSK